MRNHDPRRQGQLALRTCTRVSAAQPREVGRPTIQYPCSRTSITMAYRARKTAHTGAKHGREAYWGPKRDGNEKAIQVKIPVGTCFWCEVYSILRTSRIGFVVHRWSSTGSIMLLAPL